jgi:hypothetical protein
LKTLKKPHDEQLEEVVFAAVFQEGWRVHGVQIK